VRAPEKLESSAGLEHLRDVATTAPAVLPAGWLFIASKGLHCTAYGTLAALAYETATACSVVNEAFPQASGALPGGPETGCEFPSSRPFGPSEN
jgi:hypothetical protein